MSRGGARAGAGRKKGAIQKRSRAIAEKEISSGRVTPLEVILKAMHTHYDAKEFDAAAVFAKDAAPYMHPKLQAVMHSGDKENPVVTDNTIRIEFVSANADEGEDT
jgi:uncharacterized protein YehS (DUF1456 family)